MASKINFKLTDTPFLVSDDGDVIGIQARTGQISFFPAGAATNALTASTSSDQAGATVLKYRNSRITVCANIGDSVKLPKAVAGMSMFVKNAGANSMDVFPFLGDSINAIAANGAFAMATVTSAQFVCMVDGTWDTQI